MDSLPDRAAQNLIAVRKKTFGSQHHQFWGHEFYRQRTSGHG